VSKLWHLLKTFPTQQWKSLQAYSSSGSAACQQLIQHFTAPPSASEIDPEVLWKKLFPDQVFHQNRYNSLLHNTLRLVESFLVLQEIGQNRSLRDTLLLSYYQQHNLPKHFAGTNRRLERRLGKLSAHDEEAFTIRLRQMTMQQYFFAKYDQQQLPGLLVQQEQLLDQVYLIEKLRMTVSILDRKQLAAIGLSADQNELLALMVNQAKDKYTELQPLIQLYWRAVQILNTPVPEIEDIITVVDLLRQQEERLAKNDVQTLRGLIINQCTRHIKQAGSALHDLLLSVYQDALRYGDILIDGYLSHNHYRNIIYISVHLKKTEFLSYFVEAYTSNLLPHLRNDAHQYHLALLAYERQDYRQAIDHLQQVEFSTVAYKLWSKELLIMTYYELEETLSLDSLLSSFEILVRRDKEMTNRQKQPYLNFIRWVRKLQRTTTALSLLAERIKRQPNLNNRRWLLSKCLES
jgi:hypothetical protein